LGGLSGDGLGSLGESVMNRKEDIKSQQEETPRAIRVRLQGFLIEKEIGLGDAINRATYAIGIKPCGACERRSAALNQWMRFSR
jgi:hypothetical protein